MPTVRDDVAFGPANLGLRGRRARRAGCDARSHAVGMDDHVDRAPHHLSFGQRRRVAVATVLAMEPERARARRADLEPRSGRAAASSPTSSRRSTSPILVVTHDLPYALELCARSVILDGGAHRRRRARPTTSSPTPSLLAPHRLELPRGFQVHTHPHRHGPIVHAHPHGHEAGAETVHEH